MANSLHSNCKNWITLVIYISRNFKEKSTSCDSFTTIFSIQSANKMQCWLWAQAILHKNKLAYGIALENSPPVIILYRRNLINKPQSL